MKIQIFLVLCIGVLLIISSIPSEFLGRSQASYVIFAELEYPFIFKRLDAQYDWLPTAMATFANKTLRLVEAGDGCKQPLPDIAGAVALVSSDNCSYFRKVQTLEQAHAIGILVYTLPGQPIQNMVCVGKECDTALHIPASMIPYPLHLLRLRNLTVRYQNTPSDNFFMAIDTEGQLAETGWFLFPSMKFLVWQAQWFNYTRSQAARIRDEALVVPVFKDKVMAGKHGVIVNVSIPPLSELQKYSKFELHMNLSCPGTRDTTCPHWDRVVGLYVCCNSTSPLCNSELGRWISPFRRRIGSWLTDVSPLLPLLSSQKCSFQMSTDPWSMPWVPTVNLRFSGLQQSNGIYPAEAKLLYQPGATFDRNYNSHFEPLHLQAAPTDVVKIVIYAVITGHGSDENGCGEFCITSHHFVVNGNIHSIEFSNAGTPFGCADRVVGGVVPNEHGTWLYGRDGWCDGQQVSPWVIDITDSISHTRPNIIKYYGWFNGTDPNPQKNPGMISLHSYLVFFKNL